MGGESGSVWRRNEHGLVHQGGVGCDHERESGRRVSRRRAGESHSSIRADVLPAAVGHAATVLRKGGVRFHLQPQGIVCLWNKPTNPLTTILIRRVHLLRALHKLVSYRAQVRHQREVLQLLVEHGDELLLRYHRHGRDGVEHLATLLFLTLPSHTHFRRRFYLVVHHLLDVLLRLVQCIHQVLHLRLQSLQVVVRLRVAVRNLALIMTPQFHDYVLEGVHARYHLILHVRGSRRHGESGELDGEDVAVQNDGGHGVRIDGNALALERHVHGEEDLWMTTAANAYGLEHLAQGSIIVIERVPLLFGLHGRSRGREPKR